MTCGLFLYISIAFYETDFTFKIIQFKIVVFYLILSFWGEVFLKNLIKAYFNKYLYESAGCFVVKEKHLKVFYHDYKHRKKSASQ